MDDEKYFSFSWNNGNINSGFYSDDLKKTPDKVRYSAKAKFEPKVLVWAAISAKGISQLYIQDSKAMAVNADVYINKCLVKLEKFIKDRHSEDDILFWPDLASCHYAKKTLEWLNTKNIPFVPKYANPPNVPKARPIEDFWGLLCQKVYEHGWEAKSTEELKKKIKSSVKKIDMNVVQSMIGGIKHKIRLIEDRGPLALYKK